MIELEEALARLLGGIAPLGSESVTLNRSCGRFASAPLTAPIPLPRFDNSMFDGYAVRSDDIQQASKEAPTLLRVVGEVPAGQTWSGVVNQGEAVRIFTGAPIPTGADAIVMQEDTITHEADPKNVRVLEVSRPWEGVRFAGEDVKQSSSVLATGQRLTAARMGLLAALGFGEVTVARRPVVGVFSTGDELVTPGSELRPGQIFESNRAGLTPLLEASGAVVRDYGIIRDDLETTTKALCNAFADCDAVVTSGGVSVGEHDHVKRALDLAGGSLDLWQVAIKPGKPFAFGKLGGKCLFGLPGNPISAMVTCLLLVRPALLKMQGASSLKPRTINAKLSESLGNDGNRRHYVRVRFNVENGGVERAGLQASHALGGFASADGLVSVQPNTSLMIGDSVEVLIWD